jgi:hypothetical protein
MTMLQCSPPSRLLHIKETLNQCKPKPADSNPIALLFEEEITKDPMRVKSKNEETLDPKSRVNF